MVPCIQSNPDVINLASLAVITAAQAQITTATTTTISLITQFNNLFGQTVCPADLFLITDTLVQELTTLVNQIAFNAGRSINLIDQWTCGCS